MFNVIVGALAKNGSFGFAKGRLVCRAKPNVPFVRLAKIVFKKCGSAKKIKHEALGCRVGKKSDVKFICCTVVSIIVVSLMVVVLSVTLAYNVLGLEEVRVLKALNFLYRKPELNVLNFIATL